MVEGGTLLRCYTSNGVSRVRIPPPPLRKCLVCRNNAKAKKWAGSTPGPYYTNGYTNATRAPLFTATNTASVIVDLYLRPPQVVVGFVAQSDLAQPNGASVSADVQEAGYGFVKTSLSRTRVNKPMMPLAPPCNSRMQQKSLIWGMCRPFGERTVVNRVDPLGA